MTRRSSTLSRGATAWVLALPALALFLAASPSCSKKDGAKDEARKFMGDFGRIRTEDIESGFFECIYGERNPPTRAKAFIEQIKRRFESNPAGFLEEKAEGCKASLQAAVGKLRGLVAPDPDIGTALAKYTAAVDDLVAAWEPVQKVMADFADVDGRRVKFNQKYAEKLGKAGDEGWAFVASRFHEMAQVDAFLAEDPRNQAVVDNAYRYVDFVLCILGAYDVEPRSLLIPDTTAEAEKRSYLRGVKALRDRLLDLCSGSPGTQTNIVEWSTRIERLCYQRLDEPTIARPALFDQIMLWWSSDGARDTATGEAYSSYAAIVDGCLKKEIDIEPALKAFVETYGAFVTAAGELERAIAKAARQ